jgi:hypothetical protein
MKNLLSIILVFASLLASSQVVKGILTNKESEPVPFATVLLFSASDTSMVKANVSDSTGFFNITLPNSDSLYFLEIQTMSFKTHTTQTFSASHDFNTIFLETDNEIKEVELTFQKPMFEVTGRGMIVNVEASPILSSGNTQEVLAKVPGMVVNQDGSLTLKGKHNVRIYMDGKPTNMDQKDLVILLENTPASEIEKIEVFETPPAKYDAAGNAGIINIVRKNGTNLGFNGSAGLNTGYGNYHKLSPWVYGNYRGKKVNIYGSSWYYNSKTAHDGTSDIILNHNGEESSFFNKKKSIYIPKGYGSRVGIDYSLSKKNTIGYLGVFYSGGSQVSVPTSVTVTGPAESNYDFIDAESDLHVAWFGQTHNLNFTRDIGKGESLNIDVDYVQRGAINDNNVVNNYFRNDTALTPAYTEQEGAVNTKMFVSKLDYERTIFKSWALETGAKASWVSNENEFLSSNGTNENDIVKNENASNDFNYDEAIYSAYVSSSRKWKDKWFFDLGVRVEHTEADGYSPTLDSTFERSYTSVFPNLALSYSIPKKYSLSASATRRVRRPSYYELNPFSNQVSQFTYDNGNPYLKAQFTDVAKFSLGLKNKYFFTLSTSQTLGQMTKIIDQQEDLERQIHTIMNVDDFYNYSFNTAVPVKLYEWWTMNWNFTFYHNKLKSNFEFGSVGYQINSFNINMQQMFILPKGFKIELSGFYNHDSYWNTYFVEPHYKLDLGVSKSIENWRFNLFVKDFLNIREGNGGVFQNTIKMATTYKPESRKVMLSIVYSFGNNKVKKERKRKTGSEDILKRASDQ